MPSTRNQPRLSSSLGPSRTSSGLEQDFEPGKSSPQALSQDKVTEPIARPFTNEEELAEQAQDTALNGVSKAYLLYRQLKLSDQLNKHGRPMIAYLCKMTGLIGPKEVPQLCAVWCAEATQPFSALVDTSHKAILHPAVIKCLLTRKAVSKNTHKLYSAIQGQYRDELQSHSLDLGAQRCIVLGSQCMAIPKWCGHIGGFLKGKYMAKSVCLVVKKFGIQNEKKKENSATGLATDEHLGSASEDDDPTGQIQILAPEEEPNSGPDEDLSVHKSEVNLDNEDEYPSKGDLEEGSEADEEQDRYTSGSCKQTLAKICAITKKLRYSPNAKAEFVDCCVAKGCKKLHNISRDVHTRWNSTNTQLQSVIQCEDAISIWQLHKRRGVERKYHLDDSDFDLACNLVQVLQIFYEITLQVSIASSAQGSNIVVFIDQITDHLSTVVKATTKYPPALKFEECFRRAGLKLTNRYYSLTNESPIYRIAILLHPLFKDEYFTLAVWEPDWITEAICLARDMWTTPYKPRALNVPTARPQATGMLAGLSSAAVAQGGNNSSDPLDIWLSGGLILEDHKPVNPLKWWIQQKRAGNTHGGLVHMALDILSCPGETCMLLD
ncbi:hypothetical protein PSTG_02660 [Puccinia striiformis f. sp. tritici PST-78]|uniref:HAT C-terminal dimerisation domain-containing protein n=1 Tax=Puccinia striiformis f. sp. tritici PST-78 TaxID=1165861 RepID=A0A0L0VYH4_9BASI|nr:hypothetical protein PSTG_02660 [Puccinia striiformis f. sp. tritici PST-78]